VQGEAQQKRGPKGKVFHFTVVFGTEFTAFLSIIFAIVLQMKVRDLKVLAACPGLGFGNPSLHTFSLS
jgi:hypothetical protein